MVESIGLPLILCKVTHIVLLALKMFEYVKLNNNNYYVVRKLLQ